MRRILVAFALFTVWMATPWTAAGDTAEAVIGGQSARIELPDGYCAMSELEPSDARLIGILQTANQGSSKVRLVFAECRQLRDWRSGELDTLNDYGYISTPDQYENTPVNMALPDFVAMLSRSMNGAGMRDFERGIEEGTSRVEERIPQIQLNETQNLGVIYEDDRALYLGLVQKIRTEFGKDKVILGSAANTVLNNRIAHMYLFTVFNDDAMAGLLTRSRDLVNDTVTANQR